MRNQLQQTAMARNEPMASISPKPQTSSIVKPQCPDTRQEAATAALSPSPLTATAKRPIVISSRLASGVGVFAANGFTAMGFTTRDGPGLAASSSDDVLLCLTWFFGLNTNRLCGRGRSLHIDQINAIM
ncbi:unnamed protein product [Cylicocyclus nassatus]|uniref:Uncharacterized protein n=1 Tax=Cylicocyclus nassatus TaxID=53992 RepID=A0AA36GTV4_CYLNA|nr:unnamed protein product [Cylicocyclus nassatus]